MNRFEQSNNPSSSKPADSIRSEINETRQRMDHTMDALADRLRGRHLFDEIVGFFRSPGNGDGKPLKDKISETTNTAVHAVVDNIKAHPLPWLVIGAGVAWMMYEKHEREHPRARFYPDDQRDPDDIAYPSSEAAWPSLVAGEETETSASFSSIPSDAERQSGMADSIREKAGNVRQRVQDKTSALKDKTREGLHHLQERAAHTGAQLRNRTAQVASRTKEQFSRASTEHPLETGAAFLALGLIAGLLTPTPQKVREVAGPVAERMRDRVRATGRDLAERGRRVASAATKAAREEAEAQQLTPEAMKERARQAANRVTSSTRSQDSSSNHPSDAPLEYDTNARARGSMDQPPVAPAGSVTPPSTPPL